MTQIHPHPPVVAAVDLGVNRYRATVAQVAPARLRGDLSRFDRGLLGISLGSKNSQGAHLEASLRWLSENFKTFALGIADSIYRYTLQVTQDVDPEQAYEMALRTGREFVEMYRPLFAQYARPGQCEIVFLSDVLISPSFQHYHAHLQQLYQEEPVYQASVDQFAQLYLRRGEKMGEELDDAHARKEQLAVAYLLEESAAFATLNDQGWPVLVYPGSLHTFVGLVEGRIPAAPAALKSLVWVEIRINRQGIYFPDRTSKKIQRRGAPALDEVAAFQATAQDFALLAGLADEDWEHFLRFAQPQSFAPRAVIIEHQQCDRNLYILTDGRVEVIVPDLQGKAKQQVRIIHAGSVFGEQSFLDGGPRTATVMAVTPCQAYVLSYAAFCQLKKEAPDLAADLLFDIGRVQSIRSRQTTEEIRLGI